MFNNAQLPPADCYGTLLVCPKDKPQKELIPL